MDLVPLKAHYNPFLIHLFSHNQCVVLAACGGSRWYLYLVALNWDKQGKILAFSLRLLCKRL